MERVSERSLSENLRRSDREDGKIIEWEEFDHELTRLWSLSSAMKLATERKQILQPKLESLIQVFLLLMCFLLGMSEFDSFLSVKHRFLLVALS
jgi:hypothetical protein